MGFFELFKRKNRKSKKSDEPIITFKSEIINQPTELEVVPVEKIIKDLEPNEAGLYPHETLLLSYAPKYYLEKNTFPKFWWYKYGMRDVYKSLKSLRDRGFLQTGSLKSAIEKETVAELKEVLRDNDLKVSGKKADLVQRLLDEVPEEKLNTIFTKFTYELTDAGKDVLEEEEYIPYIHRHSIEDLDIWSMSKKVKEKPGYRYRDIIWGYLNERSLEHFINNDFGLYRNARFTMSEFLKEEDKLDTAFFHLAEVVRHDLSGLSNGFNMRFMDIHAKYYFPYNNSIVTMAPGITSRIVDYQEEKGLSDDELKNKLIEQMHRIQLPFSIFTVDECAEIVIMKIHEDEVGLEKIYDKAEKRFEKEYRIK